MTSDQPPKANYPPPDAEPVARWVLDEPTQLSDLRAGLASRLSVAGATGSGDLTGVVDQMVLVASELATNAIVHGLPPTIVRLLDSGEELVLDVVDHAPDEAPEVDDGRAVGDGGLGLQIATRMAMDIGWFAEGAEKHVWARFPRR
ncbi:ATP-binding protein [Georgenia sp. 10Sc9-8]|uniref:ATP-binding protein n=1 Tax=Georgenia halotolerans TaxID=3028317 RepID=A0ABT5TW88_9MICO|nr:ATP-binding protein [Georgenia halotolerans]